MDLVHEFTIPAPIEQAWDVITDVPRVARCMPGTSLDGQDGESYRGTVSVKVGALTVQFRGAATITDRDDSAHRLTLRCDARDIRGASTVGATVTMSLTAYGPESTRARVETALNLSGRFAQFGRGMLQDVTNVLLDRFVRQLKTELEAPAPAGAPTGPTMPTMPTSDPVPVDLGAVMLPALARSAGPVVVAALIVAVMLVWFRRRGP